MNPSDPEAVKQAAWISQWLGPGDLAPVGADDIHELTALLREDHYQAGDMVFVRSGAVELSRTIKGRRVVLQIMLPGDVFGDVSLFLRIKVPWDAVALEDSLILSADSVSLYHLLEQRPRLAWRWLHSTSARVHGFWFRVVELLSGGLEAQVASVLLRRSEHGVLHLSQGNLAELIGHPRTSINRALKHLESQGLIRVRYGEVDVLDPHGLAQVAGME
jgi:CRP-like cAMP-binding protein